MTKRVRLGAIGAGWWATTNHFPIFAARDDVELVSVCRPDQTLLREVQDTFGFRHATEHVEELLAQELDAVVVTTPHDLHFPHASGALAKGLHVLCEKPMTLKASQAWDLVRQVEQVGTHFLVPYGWHYKPFIVEAKKVLLNGALGEIEFVQCFMASPTKEFFAGDGTTPDNFAPTLVAPDPRTWQDASHGGGYANGQVTHSSALTLWLTDLRAQQVSAVMSRPSSAVDMYDVAQIRFDSGAIGSVVGAATLPDGSDFQIDIRIFGSRGVLLLDVERERAEFRFHDGTVRRIDVTPGEGRYTCEVPPARFVDLIVGNSDENNSTVETGARSVELIEAMYASAKADGQPIVIDSTSGHQTHPEDRRNAPGSTSL